MYLSGHGVNDSYIYSSMPGRHIDLERRRNIYIDTLIKLLHFP